MAEQNQSATGRPPLTDAERVLLRAQSLQRNKGRGWSKAIDQAARTLEPGQESNRKWAANRGAARRTRVALRSGNSQFSILNLEGRSQ